MVKGKCQTLIPAKGPSRKLSTWQDQKKRVKGQGRKFHFSHMYIVEGIKQEITGAASLFVRALS